MNVFPQLLQKFSIHNCSMIMTLQTIADQLSRRTEPPENISVNDHIYSQHFRFQFQMQCYAYIHKRSIELNSEYYYILYGSWADRQLLYFVYYNYNALNVRVGARAHVQFANAYTNASALMCILCIPFCSYNTFHTTIRT